jgi:hypothetical protein
VLMGRVVDPEGRPVPGVLVTWTEGRKILQSATDREGVFILGGLPAGRVEVELRKAGYRTSTEPIGADVAPERYTLFPE